jgi:hypothetical protein
MSNINEFPIDNSLKELITNLVTSYMQRAGIEMSDNKKKWFKDNCSAELIENILDSIIIWERKNLNKI